MIKILKYFLNLLGINIIKYKKKTPFFSEIYISKIKKNPIIIDIGANIGQSTNYYLDIFKNPEIHCFEPNEDAFRILKENFKENDKVKLNNFALGNIKEYKKFYISIKSGSSSFHKVNKKSKWIKQRSREYNTTPNKFIKKTSKIQVRTLNDYIKKNKIKKIDLIKIDTQGHEKDILIGCREIFKKKIIKFIQLEVMLDDCYNVRTNFYEIEKILIPYGFKMVGIVANKENVFTDINFGANVIYMKS